jgi:predicted exporter
MLAASSSSSPLLRMDHQVYRLSSSPLAVPPPSQRPTTRFRLQPQLGARLPKRLLILELEGRRRGTNDSAQRRLQTLADL